MAPKRTQKVVAAVHESLPRPGHKRAKIADPVGDKVTALSAAISDPQAVDIQGTAVCRDMLVAAMPHALKVPRNERHSFQEGVASMVSEILTASKESWEQKVQDAQKAMESASAERSCAASARDEANDELKEAQAAVVNAKEMEMQSADAEKAAKLMLEATDKEVLDFEDNKLAKATKLEESQSVYKDDFDAMKSPGAPLPAKDQKVHLSKVVSFLKRLSADASLITAIPECLKKMPAERTAFDSVAVDNVDTLLTNHIASLQSDLDNSDSIKAQKIEAQAQARAALDSEKEKVAASTAVKDTACQLMVDKQTKTKATLKDMVTKQFEADNAAKHLAEQQKGLDKATELVSMVTFLVERDVFPEEESKVDEKVASMMEEVPAVAEPQAMQVV